MLITRGTLRYPAVTLISRSISEKGYKGSGDKHHIARHVLIKALSNIMEFDIDKTQLALNNDAIDAAICVLAAVDFAQGKVHLPNDISTARKESWIWAKK